MIETHTFSNSSLVHSAAYDTDGGLLSVTLHGDIDHPRKTFGYGGCTQRTWEDFKVAEKPGRFYGQVIRKNHLALGESTPLAEPLDEFYLQPGDIDDFDPPPAALVEAMMLTKSAAFIPDDRLRELHDQAAFFATEALTVTVRDAESLVLAENVFKAGKDLQKLIEEEVQPVTKQHYDSWKRFKDWENKILLPIEEATDRLSKLVYRFRAETERLAAIEREEMAKQAKIQAAEDQERRTEELKAQLVADGADPAELEHVEAAPMIPFVPRGDVLPPKTAGTTMKKKLVAQVDNLDDLIIAVAEGIKIKRASGQQIGYFPPVGCLEANLSVLNSQCKGRTEGEQLWPGVSIKDDGGLAKVRSKKSNA